MEIEKIKEKFQCEIKWGVYYYISSLILISAYIFLQVFVFNSNPDLIYDYVLWSLKLVVYLGFLFACILELNRLKGFSVFSKLGSMINILLFGLIFNSIIIQQPMFIISKNEIEIQIMTEEGLLDSNRNRNFLNNLITKIKLKVSRLL